MTSESLQEALMTELLNMCKKGAEIDKEVEIIDVDMRSLGQWRLIFWIRPQGKLVERFGSGIRTLLLHQNSIVEVYPDAPQPNVPNS